ncbi:class I SAM-dependent methyltransferase [Sphingobium sufflavum]|uniref:O-methyltransferase n=1 Tax=Sphingobium sufflavum TaxID=1129547 RepID=UPI001F1BB51B|nr:class I SAM-dependent methyltransferase [Sphingobium sufflavum]MCE7795971.1 class I SAM-dependent methyltransferase [Sphingobium sufflavum]
MDDTIQAVLDHYHARIAQEQAQRAAHPTGPASASPTATTTLTAPDRDERLLAVGPETGRLINIIARAFDKPNILEIGTSYGYSGIWLAHAARESGGRLTTLELQDYKAAYAREQSEKAGLADYVDFQVGDALALIDALPHGIDFVLLDLWKDLYTPCLDAFYPKLNPGAIIVADNINRPGGPGIEAYLKALRTKKGISSLLLPVGTGIEVSRYDP